MQEYKKIILIFVIFVVGTITISTINDVFGQHQDNLITKQLKEQIESSSLILTTGFVTTESNSYSISDNIEIRHVYPGKMMRIYGLTTDGYPFYVVHRENLVDQSISGTVFTINGHESVVPYAPGPEVLQSDSIESEPEDQELKTVVLVPHHVYWRQFLNVNVKVFDAAANPLNDYWFKSNLVANVPVFIEISHESGTHLGTIEGITDDNGFFRGSQYITENLVRAGAYGITITIDDDQVQELTTFVRGEIVGSRDDRFNKTGLK